jgi:hypothetical protein
MRGPDSALVRRWTRRVLPLSFPPSAHFVALGPRALSASSPPVEAFLNTGSGGLCHWVSWVARPAPSSRSTED